MVKIINNSKIKKAVCGWHLRTNTNTNVSCRRYHQSASELFLLLYSTEARSNRSIYVKMDRYQKIEKNAAVGEGTYGVVYKAKDKQTDSFVALKRIRLEVEDEGIPSTTLREISVLRQLRHPNIVELTDVVQSEGRLYLVFEFVDKDLKKYMEACDGPLNPQLIKSYTHQMLKGLEFCHVRGVMHRDLKPQNILVSRDGRLKLGELMHIFIWFCIL